MSPLSEAVESVSYPRPEGLPERFKLGGVRNRGGMAVVFNATEANIGLPVVVKVPLGSDEQSLARFRVEAEALERLRLELGPAVVDLRDKGDRFVVLGLIKGQTLTEFIESGRRKPRSVYDFLALVSRLARFLQEVHSIGIVHRDVKPDNIIIVDSSTGPQPVLIDYGVALLDGNNGLTQDGSFVGTKTHAAPEQKHGKKVGPAADVYAVGVVLYEVLTGQRPIATSEVAVPLTPLKRQYRLPIIQLVEGVMTDQPSKRLKLKRFIKRLDKLMEMPVDKLVLGGAATTYADGPAPLSEVSESTTGRSLGESQRLTAPRTRLPGLNAGLIAAATVLVAGAVGVWIATRAGGVAAAAGAAVVPGPAESEQVALPDEPALIFPRGVKECERLQRPDMVCIPEMELTEGLDDASAEELCAALGPDCTEPYEDADGKTGGFHELLSSEGPCFRVHLSTFLYDRTEYTCGRLVYLLNTKWRPFLKPPAPETTPHENPDGTLGPAMKYRYVRIVVNGVEKRIYDLYDETSCLAYQETTNTYKVKPGMAEFPIDKVPPAMMEEICEAEGKRLPTAAQAEAARRGLTNSRYPYGPDEPSCSGVTFDQEEHASGLAAGCAPTLPHQPGPRAVCTSPQDITQAGLCDLAGNVAEATRDHHQGVHPPCQNGICVDPHADPPNAGALVDILGGSFLSHRGWLFSAVRSFARGDDPAEAVGFRCAITITRRTP